MLVPHNSNRVNATSTRTMHSNLFQKSRAAALPILRVCDYLLDDES